MIRNISILSLTLLFNHVAIGHAQGVAPGTTYVGSVPVAGITIPLLEGTWQVVAVERAEGTSPAGEVRPPLVRAMMAQIGGPRLARWMYINASDGRDYTGGWKRDADTCDRKDVHFSYSDKNYSAKDTQCWVLNHKGMTLSAAAPQVAVDFYRWSDDKGRPNTALSLNYYLVKGSSFLQVDYTFNPVADGFPDTPTADWRGNPWHLDIAPKDPKKLAYLKQLKEIGDGMFSKLRATMRM